MPGWRPGRARASRGARRPRTDPRMHERRRVTTEPTPAPAAPGRRIRQFVLCGDAHPAAAAARGDVRDLRLLPAGRRHRRFDRGRARSALPRSRRGATISRRSMPASSTERTGALAAAGARLRPAAGRFPRRHRRHGNGRARRYPRAQPGPISISIATGWRARSAACRSGFSAWMRSPGRELAHHLGRALQLTNILRDLDEDAGVGRLYLPREALDAGRHRGHDPVAVLASRRSTAPAPSSSSRRAVISTVPRRRSWRRAPRRAVRAPRIMGEVYRLMLERMAARGFAPPRPPVRLGRLRLVFILARYAFI